MNSSKFYKLEKLALQLRTRCDTDLGKVSSSGSGDLARVGPQREGFQAIAFVSDVSEYVVGTGDGHTYSQSGHDCQKALDLLDNSYCQEAVFLRLEGGVWHPVA